MDILEAPVLVGLNLREPPVKGALSIMENVQYDVRLQAWVPVGGWSPYFINQPSNAQWQGEGYITSCYAYNRHNGAQQWLLFETSGNKLQYVNGSTESWELLATDRYVPPAPEPASMYNIHGQYCVITNGFNKPMKYRGGNRLFSLGWYERPSAPQPVGVAARDSDSGSNSLYCFATSSYLGITGTVDADILATQDTQGLGVAVVGETNKYYWRCSFISENGSESPLSPVSQPVEWTTRQTSRNGAPHVPTMVVLLQNIPVGPAGTVARRIYRTKRIASELQDGTFYEEAVIANNTAETFWSYRSDEQLGSEAPSDTDSILMPSPSCRFSGSYKGCLFIDGGKTNPSVLYFTNPGQVDSFGLFNILDAGTRTGGDITGLYSYYNSLIVFRENAIDLVQGEYPNFKMVPFVTGIGTKSPNAVSTVPDLGVVFLAQDGVYTISAGAENGEPSFSCKRISDEISPIISRLTQHMLGSAHAVYSSRYKEWHLYCALDGSDRVNMGLVLHLAAPVPAWSTRPSWPCNCSTVDYLGNIIFGSYYKIPELVATGQNDVGLMVLNGRRAAGVSYSTIPGEQGLTYNYIYRSAPTSRIRTQWMDFGYPSIKKQVKRVILYLLTKGDNTLTLKVFTDRRTNQYTDTHRVVQQAAELADQDVYGVAKWDTAEWQDQALTTCRFDIDPKILNYFAFELETASSFALMGFSVEYQVVNQHTHRSR